jgi:hypothetical protein
MRERYQRILGQQCLQHNAEFPLFLQNHKVKYHIMIGDNDENLLLALTNITDA